MTSALDTNYSFNGAAFSPTSPQKSSIVSSAESTVLGHPSVRDKMAQAGITSSNVSVNCSGKLGFSVSDLSSGRTVWIDPKSDPKLNRCYQQLMALFPGNTQEQFLADPRSPDKSSRALIPFPGDSPTPADARLEEVLDRVSKTLEKMQGCMENIVKRLDKLERGGLPAHPAISPPHVPNAAEQRIQALLAEGRALETNANRAVAMRESHIRNLQMQGHQLHQQATREIQGRDRYIAELESNLAKTREEAERETERLKEQNKENGRIRQKIVDDLSSDLRTSRSRIRELDKEVRDTNARYKQQIFTLQQDHKREVHDLTFQLSESHRYIEFMKNTANQQRNSPCYSFIKGLFYVGITVLTLYNNLPRYPVRGLS